MTNWPRSPDDLRGMYNRRILFLFFILLFFAWNWSVAEKEVERLMYIGYSCVVESEIDIERINGKLDTYIGLRNAP